MTDPYVDRRDQMFPQLTAAQLGIFRCRRATPACAPARCCSSWGAKHPLLRRHRRAVEIVRPLDGARADHGPRPGNSRANQHAVRPPHPRPRPGSRDGSIVVVDREHLRALVQRDFELSEILMRAFILRRVRSSPTASAAWSSSAPGIRTHAAHQRVPDSKRTAVHLPGGGERPRRAGAAGSVPRRVDDVPVSCAKGARS